MQFGRLCIVLINKRKSVRNTRMMLAQQIRTQYNSMTSSVLRISTILCMVADMQNVHIYLCTCSSTHWML